MKAILDQENRRDIYSATNDNKLNVAYPQLYCPRCGSYEIGLRRFVNDQAVWGCRDCAASFTLDFPRQRRF
jgi:transposase-like protein